MSVACFYEECAYNATQCAAKCTKLCGDLQSVVKEFECQTHVAKCICEVLAYDESHLGVGSSSGGGVHPAVWGSLIGLGVMICCAITFYKYWCGNRGSGTEIIQIIRK